ncbi:alanine racemase [Anaerofilum sp. BX8]|uniref:Alanine racemase n=1 Tax=Anaerofilum hominis TaxID=2763016 RepID=A0A923I5A8_9FIRM|nr:alanine racemase [Anaerofilum hominis]MBC5580591.1 alanine racemase [Anaerofilum hominis]
MEFEKRCWAEIDLDKIEHNFRVIKRRAPHSMIMAVVKADAYGHGDAVIASTLEEAGADRFAVSGFAEALRLRRAGVTRPILVLGYTSPQKAAMLAINTITQTVYSLEYARQLSEAAVAAGVTVNVHIKLDTGMGRIGFAVRDDMEAAVAQVCEATALPGLCHIGIFTHFAVADSALPEDISYTKRQFELFCEAVRRLAARGVTFPVAHCCNSAAILAYPDMQLDMVRPGVILYGYRPSPDVTCSELCGALELKAAVSLVKSIRRGDDLSYGRIFTADRDMQVATLSVGYADGYQRALSNRGVVSIHGRPAPVVGRVCMDQIIVDVTGIPGVQQGDVATIFGGGAADSVDDIADKCGTVNYEIICDIGRRVQRVYTRGGKPIQVTDYME